MNPVISTETAVSESPVIIGNVTEPALRVKFLSRAYENFTVVACDCGCTVPVTICFSLLINPVITFVALVGARPGAVNVVKDETCEDEYPAELFAEIL